MKQQSAAIQPKHQPCAACGEAISVTAKYCPYCGVAAIKKTIELPTIVESAAERSSREFIIERLRCFLVFSTNPVKALIDEVFYNIETLPVLHTEIQEILNLLLEHPYKPLRERVAYVLAQSPSGEKRIFEMLASDQLWLQATAVKALGRIHSKKAVPTLLFLLENTNDFWLKKDILFALGEIGDVQSFNTIMRTLEAPEPEVLIAAATALKNIADPAAIPYLVPKLIHQNTAVAAKVYEVIKSFGKQAVPSLLKILSSQKTRASVKRSLLRLLEEIPDPMTVPLLISLLDQEQETVVSVIKIIGAWRLPECIPVLERFTKSEDREIRLEAQGALKQIKGLA